MGCLELREVGRGERGEVRSGRKGGREKENEMKRGMKG